MTRLDTFLQYVKIEDADNGKSVTAQIVDKCPGCNGYSLGEGWEIRTSVYFRSLDLPWQTCPKLRSKYLLPPPRV